MAVWKVKSQRKTVGDSNWKPWAAGEPTLLCKFLHPSPDGDGAFGLDGALRIQADVVATWERKQDRDGSLEYGSNGVTEMRIALRRGNDLWMQGAGWVTLDPMLAVNWISVPVTSYRVITDPTWGTIHAEIDESIGAEQLGPGELTVSIYLEGHPRSTPRRWFEKNGWDPSIAGTFTNTVMIDGDAPQTTIDHSVPTGSDAYIVGHATDNHGVKQVLLTVIDQDSGEFLDANHDWVSYRRQIEVPVDGNGRWEWRFPSTALPRSRRFRFEAQAEDVAFRPQMRHNKAARNNLDPTPAVSSAGGQQ